MKRIFNENRPDINLTLRAKKFRVEQLPRYVPELKWQTEAMRSYAQPVLLWITRGQGRITMAGITHGFGPHNAIFLPANTMFGYEMLGQAYGTLLLFPEESDFSLPEEPVHFRFRDVQQQAELTGLIENISRELDNEQPGQTEALRAHAGLLTVWLARQSVEENLHPMEMDAARRLAAAFSSMVERDFRSGRPINDYAQHLGVTPTHLTRSCNAACGKSASALLSDRLHFEARKLLQETRHPVKDIAASLGFRSAAYFTRAFQKQTGLTPTAFRKQH